MGRMSTRLFQSKCIEDSFFNDTVKPLLNTTFGGYGCNLTCPSFRQWIYQSCRQFGFFQTTTGNGHPFAAFAVGNVERAGREICRAVYGLPADYEKPNTYWTNTNYGSRRI